MGEEWAMPRGDDFRTSTRGAWAGTVRRMAMDGTMNEEMLHEAAGEAFWCMDRIELSPGRIEVSGWAIPPPAGHAGAGFAFNGRDFEEVAWPTPRPDIDAIFNYLPGMRQGFGFVCRSRFPERTCPPDGFIRISYTNLKTSRPFRDDHDYYFPTREEFPLPPPGNRKRVHGSDFEISFRLEGYSSFVKLGQAVQDAFQAGLGDFRRILDWGCGCGRVTRYFSRTRGPAITGVDIDAESIRWCRSHLRFGEFDAIPLHPPTRLGAGSFDLIAGISIFTHLKEREQFEWLAELARIAAPGAAVLVSINGPFAACRTPVADALRLLDDSGGFLDLGSDNALDGVIGESGYYRSTFHGTDYVRKRWSAYFDILRIIPGYIGNNQDLVVMRKR